MHAAYKYLLNFQTDVQTDVLITDGCLLDSNLKDLKAHMVFNAIILKPKYNIVHGNQIQKRMSLNMFEIRNSKNFSATKTMPILGRYDDVADQLRPPANGWRYDPTSSEENPGSDDDHDDASSSSSSSEFLGKEDIVNKNPEDKIFHNLSRKKCCSV